MSVKIVTPSEAAREKSHPDHARWVKEQTLAIEANHAKECGLSFRAAEDANIKSLQRLDARTANRRPSKRKKEKQPPRNDEHAKIAGVTRSKPKIRPAPRSACNFCGLCLSCKRIQRISTINTKAREGDRRAESLAWEMFAVVSAMQRRCDYKDALGREIRFSALRGVDVVRAVNTGFEWACDRSTSFLGEWR